MNLVYSYVFSLQAIKTALHMLENGATIEDAKAVCAPSDLFLLAKWKVHENDESHFLTVSDNYDLFLSEINSR